MPRKPERWPRKRAGAIGASSTQKTPSPRRPTSRRHTQGTSKRVWGQPPRHLGAFAPTGFHSKKNSQNIASATKCSGGSSAANSKDSTAEPSFTWMSAAWITACIVNMPARPGANGSIRPWPGNVGSAPASSRPHNKAGSWPRWCFRAVATRRWWTFISKRCSCPHCHLAASSCWTTPAFISRRPHRSWWQRRVASSCFCHLLARPQSHRTSLGRLQDPSAQRPRQRRQHLPFYSQYVPMLLLIAIVCK